MLAEGSVPIRTWRLDLLPLEVAHAEEMAAVLDDPELHAFTGGEPSSAGDLRARYERWATGSPDPRVSWRNWVIRLRESGHLVGTLQATITDETAEIAWVVGSSWQRQGIATEAAGALVTWLGSVGVTTVIAHIHPNHVASAAVAAAAGLTRTERVHDGEIRWVLSAS